MKTNSSNEADITFPETLLCSGKLPNELRTKILASYKVVLLKTTKKQHKKEIDNLFVDIKSASSNIDWVTKDISRSSSYWCTKYIKCDTKLFASGTKYWTSRC